MILSKTNRGCLKYLKIRRMADFFIRPEEAKKKKHILSCVVIRGGTRRMEGLAREGRSIPHV